MPSVRPVMLSYGSRRVRAAPANRPAHAAKTRVSQPARLQLALSSALNHGSRRAGLRISCEVEVSVVLSAASLSPAIAILFGVLILVFPRMLNYLVAIYLILSGLI